MNETPKTIQIFLPGGDPQGIRVAEITTRIVQVVEVPRSMMAEFLKMPESDQVALYFLFGGEEENGEQKVYIGQSGNLRARLTKHNKEKDFWERALILISRTQSLTQTHALFLEWHCIKTAREVGRYADENGNSGIEPHTPAPMQADCLEIFETGRTLLATLGYPIFNPVSRRKEDQKASRTFVCTASDGDGRGIYTEEGFVVLAGSSGRKDAVKSLEGTFGANARKNLLQSGVLAEEGGRMVFKKDHLFKSPSGATVVLLGRHANGWVEWKSEDGRTLDEIERQMPAAGDDG